jgi:hypothetical protein
MRSRRIRTVVALAPILIAVLAAVSVAACERDARPKPVALTTPVTGLGSSGVPPASATSKPVLGLRNSVVTEDGPHSPAELVTISTWPKPTSSSPAVPMATVANGHPRTSAVGAKAR